MAHRYAGRLPREETPAEPEVHFDQYVDRLAREEVSLPRPKAEVESEPVQARESDKEFPQATSCVDQTAPGTPEATTSVPSAVPSRSAPPSVPRLFLKVNAFEEVKRKPEPSPAYRMTLHCVPDTASDTSGATDSAPSATVEQSDVTPDVTELAPEVTSFAQGEREPLPLEVPETAVQLAAPLPERPASAATDLAPLGDSEQSEPATDARIEPSAIDRTATSEPAESPARENPLRSRSSKTLRLPKQTADPFRAGRT